MLTLKKEGLAIASGSEVFAYSYSGHVQKIAERPGRVADVGIYRDMLLDCGNYKGIHNTVTGEIVAGRDRRWHRIASLKHVDEESDLATERLYAAVTDPLGEDYGIFELGNERYVFVQNPGSPEYSRNGKTRVLFSWLNMLFDGGKYFEYWDERKVHDYSITDSFSHDISLSPNAQAVLRVVPFGESAYQVMPTRIDEAFVNPFPDDPEQLYRSELDFAYIPIFEMDTELIRARKAILNLGTKEAAKFRFEPIIRKYAHTLPGGFLEKYQQSLDMYSASDEIGQMISRTEGFTSAAIADGKLFAGRANGQIMYILPPKVNHNPEAISRVAVELKHPIQSLCRIPEEVMNNGIRQKIVRNISMRAVHAKQSAARIRRVA